MEFDVYFGKKKSFDTYMEAKVFAKENGFTSYKITRCVYPDMEFYIIEWED